MSVASFGDWTRSIGEAQSAVELDDLGVPATQRLGRLAGADDGAVGEGAAEGVDGEGFGE